MPLIFAYGTLQEDHVQLSTFGRLLQGRRDRLPGYEPSLAAIDDPRVVKATGKTHHTNVSFTGRPASHVNGVVFEITDAELEAADRYERLASYVRIAATAASGERVWIYVLDGSDTGTGG
jgi:gamma-glutamylcyclotransferase (GGCT)/AIG2-like uncharacterized protein YtfP